MFKVLVANRGEIALRVIRALKEMSIASVAVYSEADRESPHVALADEAWCVGPGAAKESYLRGDRILTAAKATQAQAIHPGYGFLSENDTFAADCEQSGITFIGPKGNVLKKLANKSATKAMVAGAGVPVIPGSDHDVKNLTEAQGWVKTLGYPVLIKASFGGGGRGIYKVEDNSQLSRAWELAEHEARSATAHGELYLEKCLEDSRHVEVQVARDNQGKTQAFIERDCTIQRRNQKLVEETPSPFVSPQVREKLLRAAALAVEACAMTGLATVEFLLLKDLKTFYFMEINKRIQVEHPVTEELLDVDLVKLQINLALGQAMPKFDFPPLGKRHSMEVRINTEDPKNNFLPTEGVLSFVSLPGGPGVRCDSYATAGLSVGTNYDSLLAKIICFTPEGRAQTIAKMKRALEELAIDGVTTTRALHQKLLQDPIFAGGDQWYSTRYMGEWIKNQNWS